MQRSTQNEPQLVKLAGLAACKTLASMRLPKLRKTIKIIPFEPFIRLCMPPVFKQPARTRTKEIPKALRAAAAGLDAQPSPGTAGQPEITQGRPTPRARAAGQPYD